MSKADQVAGTVRRVIERFAASSNESKVKADMANLRRGMDAQGEISPQTWGIFLEEMPEDLYGKANGMSAAERAAYTSLSLYAIAQQGNDLKNENQYLEGQSLAKALRKYVDMQEQPQRENTQARIEIKMKNALSSKNVDDLGVRLRSLIRLISSSKYKIPVDYPALAKDLYNYSFPESRARVRIKWARDFYRLNVATDDINKNQKDSKE